LLSLNNSKIAILDFFAFFMTKFIKFIEFSKKVKKAEGF